MNNVEKQSVCGLYCTEVENGVRRKEYLKHCLSRACLRRSHDTSLEET